MVGRVPSQVRNSLPAERSCGGRSHRIRSSSLPATEGTWSNVRPKPCRLTGRCLPIRFGHPDRRTRRTCAFFASSDRRTLKYTLDPSVRTESFSGQHKRHSARSTHRLEHAEVGTVLREAPALAGDDHTHEHAGYLLLSRWAHRYRHLARGSRIPPRPVQPTAHGTSSPVLPRTKPRRCRRDLQDRAGAFCQD